MTQEDTKEINEILSSALTDDDKLDIEDDEIQNILETISDIKVNEEEDADDSKKKKDDSKKENKSKKEEKKEETQEKKPKVLTPKRERKVSLRKAVMSRSINDETSSKRTKLARGMSEAAIVPKYKTQISRLAKQNSQMKERSNSLPGDQECPAGDIYNKAKSFLTFTNFPFL